MGDNRRLKEKVKETIERVVERQDISVFDEKVILEDQRSEILEEFDEEVMNYETSIRELLEELEDEKFIKLSEEGCISLLKSNSVKGVDDSLEGNIPNNVIKEILDESYSDIDEIMKFLETDNPKSKSKLILALEASENKEILQNKKIKNKFIEMLLKEDDAWVYSNLESIVDRIYDNDNYFINKLLLLLEEEDFETKSKVADILKIFDKPKVNSHLIEKLHDDSIQVRISALKTLMQKDNYEYTEIENALEDWNNDLQIKEERESRYRKEGIEIQEEEPEVESREEFEDMEEGLSWKEAVKEAIRRVTERKGEPTFSRQTLIDEEMDFIKKATGTKGSSPKQSVSRVLQELWKEENFISHEREGVYKLLENEVKEEAEVKRTEEEMLREKKEKLLTDVSEENIELKEVKDKILRYSNDESFLKKLLDQIEGLDWKYRYQLVKIISEKNENVVLEKLIELLKDPNEWVREASAEALTKYPRQNAVPKVAEMLENSKKERSRVYAAEILGEFDDEEALEALDKALEDQSPSVREEALNSIDKISHRKVIEILEKAKKSEYPDVRSEAKRILQSSKYDKSKREKESRDGKKNNSLFTKDSVYLRNKIHERLGGNENSKLSRSSNNSHVFLFYRKDEEYKHPFGWQEDGSFHFILDKFEHDIRFEDLSSLIKHKKNNKKIHLFRDLKGNKTKYQGEMNIEKYNIIKVKGEVKKIILKLFPIEKSTKETNTNENKDSDNRESSKRGTMNQVSSDNERGEKENNQKNKDMLNNLKEEFKLD